MRRLFAGLALAALAACAGPTIDAAGSCRDLCKSAGAGGFSVESDANEVTCICAGGTITDAACHSMCAGVGKGNSRTAKSMTATTDNVCQCT